MTVYWWCTIRFGWVGYCTVFLISTKIILLSMHYESSPRIGLQKHKYNFEKIHCTGMENKVEIETLKFTNTKRQIHQFWKYKYRNISYLIRRRSCSSWLCPLRPTWASSIAHVAEHWTSGKIQRNEIDLYILPPFLA